MHKIGSFFKEEDGSKEINPQARFGVMDEVEVIIHHSICTLIQKTYHQKSYPSDIEYHIPPNIKFSVVIFICYSYI